jgi:hypothetical protein
MKSGLTFLFCALFCAASTSASPGQQSSTPLAAPQDKTPPSYDMKAQAILDLQQMQQKFTSLAAAVPEEKYTWRPGDGARTFGELFLHTAAAGFNFPTMKGTPAAPDFTAKGFEKSTTDKARIIKWSRHGPRTPSKRKPRTPNHRTNKFHAGGNPLAPKFIKGLGFPSFPHPEENLLKKVLTGA